MRITMKKIVVALAMLATAATAAMPAAFAEGSKNLMEIRKLPDGTPIVKNNEVGDSQKAHRPYLEWRDRLQLNAIESESVIYVYAEAGETVYFGSNIKHASDASITAINYYGNLVANGMTVDADGNEVDTYTDDVKNADKAIKDVRSRLGNLRGATIAVTIPMYNPKAYPGDVTKSGKAYDPGRYYVNQAGYLDQEGHNKSDKDYFDLIYKPLTYENGKYLNDITLKREIKLGEETINGTGYADDYNEKIREYNETVSDEDKLSEYNTVFLFKVGENGEGLIKNGTAEEIAAGTDQESVGPKVDGIAGTENGYNPFSFVAPLTGTYSFRFLSSDYNAVDKMDINPYVESDDYTKLTWVFDSLDLADSSSVKVKSVQAKEKDISITTSGEVRASDVAGYDKKFSVNKQAYYITVTPPEPTGKLKVTYAANVDFDEVTDTTKNDYGKWGGIDIVQQGTTVYSTTKEEEKSMRKDQLKTYEYTVTSTNPITIYRLDHSNNNTKIGGSTSIYKVEFEPEKSEDSDALYNKIHPDIDTWLRNAKNAKSKFPSDKDKGHHIFTTTDEPWKENTCTIAAWDVTVVGSNGNGGKEKKLGRAWSDILFLNAGDHRLSIYSNVYVLTRDGFLYRFASNGMQPYAFMFYANNRGFLYDPEGKYNHWENEIGPNNPDYDKDEAVKARRALQPLEHSFYSKGTGIGLSTGDVGDPPVHTLFNARGKKIGESRIIRNYSPTDEHRDWRHKIFFNNPDPKATTDDGKLVANPSDGNAIKAYVEDTDGDGEGELAEGIGDYRTVELLTKIKPYFKGDGDSALNDVVSDGDGGYINYGTRGVGGSFKFTLKVIDPDREDEGFYTEEDRVNEDRARGIYYVTKDEIAKLNGKQLRLKLDFSKYQLQLKAKEKDSDHDEYEPVTIDGKWQERTGTAQNEDLANAEKNNMVWFTATIVDDGYPDKEYEVPWDGRDIHGNIVPAGVYNQHVVELYYEGGTVHFPLLDVERLPYGVKVKMLNRMTKLLTSADTLYYNNEATPPEYEWESTNASKNAPTAWYFTGAEVGKYPLTIGAGNNWTSGVSTNFDTPYNKDKNGVETGVGALKYGDYYDEDGNDINGDGERTGYSSTSGDAAYGNFAAIDMWTKYNQQLAQTLIIGINDEDVVVDEDLNPIVSFVAQKGNVKNPQVAQFNRSHVRWVGNKMYTGDYGETYEKSYYPNYAGNVLYGNTISTGFVSEVQLDNTYNSVTWDIVVPYEGTYVKVGNDDLKSSGDSNAAKNGWVALIDSTNPLLTDVKDVYKREISGTVTEEMSSVLYNNGSIYATIHQDADEPDAKTASDKKFRLMLKYDLPEITTTGTSAVVYGLVLDNIYAPGSKGYAQYIPSDVVVNNIDMYNKVDWKTVQGTSNAAYAKDIEGFRKSNWNTNDTDKRYTYTYDAYYATGNASWIDIIGIVDMFNAWDDEVENVGDIQDPGDVETNDNNGNVTDSTDDDEFDALIVNE